MTVGVDATGTVSEQAVFSPFNYTGLTVGTGNGLFAAVLLKPQTAWTGLTRTLNWDATGTPQAMSRIGFVQETSNNFAIELWGIIAPTAGNKTLRYTWTGGSSPTININAISLTGVLQTSTALAFPTAHFNSASNASSVGPASVAVTSAIGNMAFFGFTANAFDNDPLTSPAGATEWISNNATNYNEAYRAAGAATVTFTGTTFGGVQAWVAAGCDVVAAAAAAAFISPPKRVKTYSIPILLRR